MIATCNTLVLTECVWRFIIRDYVHAMTFITILLKVVKMQKEQLNRKTIEQNKFTDTNRVIRSRNLKDRQYNDQHRAKKRTNNDLQNTT